MLKTFSPGFQVLVFLFIVYFMAAAGDYFYLWSLSFAVDQEMLVGIDGLNPRIYLSRILFFQIFAFLLAFMLMLRYLGQDFRSVIDIKKMTLKPALITFAVFILGLVGMQFLGWVNAPLADYLPTSALDNEVATNAMQEKLVYHDNFVQFIFALIVMAGLPAICEELVFRGFLLRKMIESGLTHHAAILLSAGIFSLTHFQPLKFLPILFMGICLGYIYHHFKNIKYAMLLHFLINASQIIYGYLVGSGLLNLDF